MEPSPFHHVLNIPPSFSLKKGPFCYPLLTSSSTYLSYSIFDLAISLYTEERKFKHFMKKINNSHIFPIINKADNLIF